MAASAPAPELSSVAPPSGGAASPASQGHEILLLSAIVLFLELAIIRWSAAQVRALAYFPNLVLMASFLGLGIGCLRAGRRPLDGWWMPLLFTAALVFAGLGRVVFTQEQTSGPLEHLWLLYYDLPPDAPVIHNVWVPILTCFAATVGVFIAPGQMIANRLRAFQASTKTLAGYGWDLGGSLAGTILFSLVAFWRLPPLAWFAIAVIAGLPLMRSSRRRLAVHAFAAAAFLLIVYRSERAEIYSPYYAISTRIGHGRAVLTNGSLHQVPLRMQADGPDASVAAGYHAPYRMLARAPRHALVLGAGTGNDVATLLQEGAESIDAVEIDPVIIELGHRLHPDHPYASARVRVINTDARAFLNDTNEKYDVIVFGTLDSMTRLSALSNVRLDNFVYTVDCIAAARKRLTADGAMFLYFMCGTTDLATRIEVLVATAFDQAPAILNHNYSMFNLVYLAGPGIAHVQRASRAARDAARQNATVHQLPAPDDDWPFLYLPYRTISRFYQVIIGAIAAMAVFGICIASPEFRRRLLKPGGVDAPMLLFGLAFLLLETRAVTAMNLAWGATWLTSAVVFGAILGMVLIGTALATVVRLRFAVSVFGIAVSLLGLYFLPNEWLLTTNMAWRTILSVIVVGAPVFFASMAFARIYTSRADVSHAFGWNLLGAVAGGLLEFTSMIVGLRALLLLALAAYLLAYLIQNRLTAAKAA